MNRDKQHLLYRISSTFKTSAGLYLTVYNAMFGKVFLVFPMTLKALLNDFGLIDDGLLEVEAKKSFSDLRYLLLF